MVKILKKKSSVEDLTHYADGLTPIQEFMIVHTMGMIACMLDRGYSIQQLVAITPFTKRELKMFKKAIDEDRMALSQE